MEVTDQQDPEDQIQHLLVALEHRTVTGQATGIVMERFGLSADEAFSFLLRLSSQQNVKLYDIALCLTTTGEAPGLQRSEHRGRERNQIDRHEGTER